MDAVPTLHLNSGRSMPILGLRTWQTVPGEAARTVEEAIKIGYRRFDCSGLGEEENEVEIGEKLREAIEGGEVSRDDLFISAKLSCIWNDPAVVRLAFESTLDLGRLKLDYLDIYMIESPISVNREHYRALGANDRLKRPKHPHTFFHDIDPLLVWKELELLVDERLVKSIGLCNFNQRQLQHILDNCRIKPASLEIELHPYLQQHDLVAFCCEHSIAVTAFAPLSSSLHSMQNVSLPSAPALLEEPILKQIGGKYGKSAAQVVLHWLVQQNIAVLPRADKLAQLRQDFDIFNFNLNNDDLKDIAQLGQKNLRYHSLDYWSDAPNYPWTEEPNTVDAE